MVCSSSVSLFDANSVEWEAKSLGFDYFSFAGMCNFINSGNLSEVA